MDIWGHKFVYFSLSLSVSAYTCVVDCGLLDSRVRIISDALGSMSSTITASCMLLILFQSFFFIPFAF